VKLQEVDNLYVNFKNLRYLPETAEIVAADDDESLIKILSRSGLYIL